MPFVRRRYAARTPVRSMAGVAQIMPLLSLSDELKAIPLSGYDESESWRIRHAFHTPS